MSDLWIAVEDYNVSVSVDEKQVAHLQIIGLWKSSMTIYLGAI